MKFSSKVYELCKKIPKGKISTYHDIAYTLNTKAYRAIGKILNKNPLPNKIPCFKIIKNNGEIGGYKLGIKEKIKRLKREGIKIKNNKVINFKKILFRF